MEAVDELLEQAGARGLVLRLDRVEDVVRAAAWFLARPPRKNLVHLIREATRPRPGGYALVPVPADATRPPGRISITRAHDGNGVSVNVVLVALGGVTWAELEKRRAEA